MHDEPQTSIVSCGQVGGSTAQMDLTLDLAEDEHTISGSLEYSTDLFDRSTVERMASHLEVWHLVRCVQAILPENM